MKYLIAALLASFPLLVLAMTREGQGGALAGPPVPYSPDYEPPADLPPLALSEPSFLESIGLIQMAMTRGERNNNPGNIRHGNDWQGEAEGTDDAFESFNSPRDGIRALAKLLRNYQTRSGLGTVRQIVTRYAPASENNTAAYIRAVAASMGVGADAALDLSDDATLAALVAAIIQHENGRNIYASADIAAAVAAV